MSPSSKMSSAAKFPLYSKAVLHRPSLPLQLGQLCIQLLLSKFTSQRQVPTTKLLLTQCAKANCTGILPHEALKYLLTMYITGHGASVESMSYDHCQAGEDSRREFDRGAGFSRQRPIPAIGLPGRYVAVILIQLHLSQ